MTTSTPRRRLDPAALGAAARGHRDRAPARALDPDAHDVPLEGRWPRRRRAGATRIGPSALTLGGLLQHLAMVRGLLCSPPSCAARSSSSRGARWATTAPTTGSSPAAGGFAPEELYRLYDDAVERADARIAAALDEGGLDFVCHVDDGNGNHASLRRLLFDLLEEYGRHTGHADLLREAVDGVTGEDPPDDWTR